MKCVSCSAEIPDDSDFCLKCGTKQDILNIDAQVDDLEEKLSVTNHSFSAKGRINCQKWIEEFGFDEVAKAINIALSQYLKFDDEHTPIKHTVDLVFAKIPGICANRKIAKEKPYMADTQKMVGYANKKFALSEYQEKEYKEHIGRLLYLFNKKASDYSKMFEDFFWKLKKSNDKWEFLEEMKELIEVWEAGS